jgi:hypothetical protein
MVIYYIIILLMVIYDKSILEIEFGLESPYKEITEFLDEEMIRL